MEKPDGSARLLLWQGPRSRELGGGNRRRKTVVADNAMVDGTPSGDGMTLRLPRVPSRKSPAIGEVARSTGNPDKVACNRVHRTCGT